MNKKLLITTILTSLVLFLLCSCVLIWLVFGKGQNNQGKLSSSEAIALIKNEYPEFESYQINSNNLQTIRTEAVTNGFLAVFVQQGYGVRYIAMHCFFVDKNSQVIRLGSLSPVNSTNELSDFSISDCNFKSNPIGGDTDEHGCLVAAGYSWCSSSSKCLRVWEETCADSPTPIAPSVAPSNCGLLTCHGTSFKCGKISEPMMCTMEYRLGDKCLQYAECTEANGQCLANVTDKFKQCVSCVVACVNKYPDQSEKQFACESECK